jgi:xylulokinase
MTAYFLGVDVGTYETKAVLTDDIGQTWATARHPNSLEVPGPGLAEHDAERTWWQGFVAVVRAIVEKSGVAPASIEAIGCSGIGPCVLPVDTNGSPLRPAILYGIDTRAAKQCQQLTLQLGEREILATTGNSLSSQSAGPKIAWLKENEPDTFARSRWFLTTQSYLVAQLTGRHVIDHTTAAYFGPLYDLQKRTWHQQWAQLVVEPERLGEILPTTEIVGGVTPAAARETGLATGTPVIVGTADAVAEAVSAGVLEPGDLMVMYGSSLFMITVLRAPIIDGRVWTAPFVLGDTFLMAAGTSTAGTLVRWYLDLVRNNSTADLDAEYEALADVAAQAPAGARGIIVLPYFSGERTPIHDPFARGVIFGLTLEHTRADVARALLEGIAHGIYANLNVMAELGVRIHRVRAVGGGVKNATWIQIASDFIQRRQEIVAGPGAAFGDAMLAAVATKAVTPADLNHWVEVAKVVEPNPALAGLYRGQAAHAEALYDSTKTLMHDRGTFAGGPS